MFDLPTIWAGLLALAIFIYVILDGFDLGIGLVFPFLETDKCRDVAMNSVAPVWDGNETWLVLGGGGLLAAFPLAYAVVLPALYAPFIVMILALVFRGVAFEYRWRDKAHEKIWDKSFFFGSLLATFTQGIVLGAFVQGIEVEGRAYAGGWWDWFTPFSMMCGVALTAGYALLGSTWLVMKTEGILRDKAYRISKITAVATLAFMGIVSLWTPFLSPEIALAALIGPTLITNGWQVMRQGLRAAWTSMVKFRVFLGSGLIVLMISAQFVRLLPQNALFLMIGVPVVVFALMQLRGWKPRLAAQSFGIEAAVGSLTGFLGGISGVWGPPTVAYLTAMDTPKTEQMRVQGAVFGLGAFALVGAHLQSGVLRAETIPLSILMVIPALAGMFIGLKIQDRIDQAAFRKATLLVLLIAGLNLVRKGVVG